METLVQKDREHTPLNVVVEGVLQPGEEDTPVLMGVAHKFKGVVHEVGLKCGGPNAGLVERA